MQPATATTPNRFPDEVERTELATELEYHLNPLAARLDVLEAAPALNEADALLLGQLTAFIAAVGRYDEATERLLTGYRHALEHAERPTAATVPTLEQALAAQQTPAERQAYWETQPAYRLGFVRGHRKGTADTEAKYERLTSLYAQHALIVPPLSYTPSPLLARLKAYLGRLLMHGPRLPLPTRQLLLSQTPTTLTDGPQR
ncbi:MAG: hypothetical protein ACRYFX_09865 [Janthinobacterium lividum]